MIKWCFKMPGHMHKEFAAHWARILKERLDSLNQKKSGEFKIQLDAGRAVMLARPNPEKAQCCSDASGPIR